MSLLNSTPTDNAIPIAKLNKANGTAGTTALPAIAFTAVAKKYTIMNNRNPRLDPTRKLLASLCPNLGLLAC